jgi:hypothetical protein
MPIFDPNQALTKDAPSRYYQNGHDVTWHVINGLPLPMSERFFPVEVR